MDAVTLSLAPGGDFLSVGPTNRIQTTQVPTDGIWFRSSTVVEGSDFHHVAYEHAATGRFLALNRSWFSRGPLDRLKAEGTFTHVRRVAFPDGRISISDLSSELLLDLYEVPAFNNDQTTSTEPPVDVPADASAQPAAEAPVPDDGLDALLGLTDSPVQAAVRAPEAATPEVAPSIANANAAGEVEEGNEADDSSDFDHLSDVDAPAVAAAIAPVSARARASVPMRSTVSPAVSPSAEAVAEAVADEVSPEAVCPAAEPEADEAERTPSEDGGHGHVDADVDADDAADAADLADADLAVVHDDSGAGAAAAAAPTQAPTAVPASSSSSSGSEGKSVAKLQKQLADAMTLSDDLGREAARLAAKAIEEEARIAVQPRPLTSAEREQRKEALKQMWKDTADARLNVRNAGRKVSTLMQAVAKAEAAAAKEATRQQKHAAVKAAKAAKAKEAVERAKRAEAERVEAERVEAERVEAERGAELAAAEVERAEVERAEAELAAAEQGVAAVPEPAVDDELRCPQGHRLVPFPIARAVSYQCDACGQGILNTAAGCRACDFDLCESCATRRVEAMERARAVMGAPSAAEPSAAAEPQAAITPPGEDVPAPDAVSDPAPDVAPVSSVWDSDVSQQRGGPCMLSAADGYVAKMQAQRKAAAAARTAVAHVPLPKAVEASSVSTSTQAASLDVSTEPSSTCSCGVGFAPTRPMPDVTLDLPGPGTIKISRGADGALTLVFTPKRD
eukprot:TRINITY_DN2373_c1_g3_i1.p1 TRINITY_DN2373_c1_g3~~TRINITY_DN2373_c1_g3_i1.p1  ORF type:complete len:736 (-),score=133.97 TRINITY_DN2373_c1_g3_i1:1441-3648(-)